MLAAEEPNSLPSRGGPRTRSFKARATASRDSAHVLAPLLDGSEVTAGSPHSPSAFLGIFSNSKPTVGEGQGRSLSPLWLICGKRQTLCPAIYLFCAATEDLRPRWACALSTSHLEPCVSSKLHAALQVSPGPWLVSYVPCSVHGAELSSWLPSTLFYLGS